MFKYTYLFWPLVSARYVALRCIHSFIIQRATSPCGSITPQNNLAEEPKCKFNVCVM